MTATMTATLDEATTTTPPRPRSVVRRRMETPWGQAQQANHVADGIGVVGTASHGGYFLSPERNAEVPEYMRNDNGWYEEDTEWSIVLVVFETLLLLASDDEVAKRAITAGEHKDTLKNWHPEAYEKFYGVKLQPGESFLNDERLFHEEHARNLVTVAAYGDWHADVPEGMVGVCARLGGRGDAGGAARAERPERYFLVPAAEYDAGHRFGFVVDPERHQEVAEFS